MSVQPTVSPSRTHLDINDRVHRATYASRFNVSEEKLRKAVRLVGSRLSTLRSHLAP